jgi:NADH-quinone oxidoreductase subunit H
MRFAFFFLAEFAHFFFIAALTVTLFLGGFYGPGVSGEISSVPEVILSVIWFLLKTYAVILVLMWIRWTYPRLRIDQLMSFCWKLLIPVGLLNILVTALVKVYF